MRTRILLYIRGVLNVVLGKINTSLAAWQLAENHKYADAFLKEFRKDRWRCGQEYLATFDKTTGTVNIPKQVEKRKSCSHVKGGKARTVGYKDYSLVGHTFCDGRSKIWCQQNCGFAVWSDGDRTQWNQAVAMMEQSSNTRTSSERIINAPKAELDTITVVCADRLD